MKKFIEWLELYADLYEKNEQSRDLMREAAKKMRWMQGRINYYTEKAKQCEKGESFWMQKYMRMFSKFCNFVVCNENLLIREDDNDSI